MSTKLKNKLSKFLTSKSNQAKRRVAFAMSEAKRIVDEQEREKKIPNQEILGNKLVNKDGAKGLLTHSIACSFNRLLIQLLVRVLTHSTMP